MAGRIKSEKEAILFCLRKNDPAGFEYLVKQYRRQAYFHALGFLGNRDDALDACQEAFTKAFNAIITLKTLECFYPWFYTILRNHCLNLIGRKKYTKTNAEYIKDIFTTRCFDPQAVLEQNDEAAMIWNTLGRLKPELREILVLKYFCEMDYNSISKLMNMPKGTVMSRLYYARKAFIKLYKKDSDENVPK